MAVRRSVILIVVFLGLAVFTSMAAVAVLSLFATPAPTIPANAALMLKVEVPLSEVEPSDVFRQLLQRAPTLRATIDLIRRAKSDARVRVLVLRPQSAGPLWAQVQELRAAVEDFKGSGKPVVAFLESGGIAEYYLASAATRIVLMPAGQLDTVGMASYELFFRRTLDKAGVYPDLLHIGEYKSASNTFTETGFTPAHREMTRAMNRDWFEDVIRTVARARRMDEAQARAALGGGPYWGSAAVESGLVDELGYDDQIDDKAPVQGTDPLSSDDYARAAVPPRAGAGDRVALLYAVGTITSGESGADAGTGAVLGSDTFVEWIRKVRVDPTIRAVVVRIDSPGGSAIASEVMWRELMLTREVKPLVVSMGDVAASGGYYIAAPAHVIVSQPGTLTGSIGVVTGKFVIDGTLEKLGIGTETVAEGASAAIYSPFRRFSPDERRRVEELMQATYQLFLQRVAEGRHQTPERIDAVAQGRVWTGRQARELGLVDELGGLDDAIRIARERARLDLSKPVNLVVYPQRRSFYEMLSSQFGTSSTTSGLDLVLRRPDVKAVRSALSMLELFRRGEPLAILPNVFVN